MKKRSIIILFIASVAIIVGLILTLTTKKSKTANTELKITPEPTTQNVIIATQSNEPATSVSPSETVEPDAIFTPIVETEAPKATDESDITEEPKATDKPIATEKATAKPTETAKPTATPNSTKDPDSLTEKEKEELEFEEYCREHGIPYGYEIVDDDEGHGTGIMLDADEIAKEIGIRPGEGWHF